MDAVLAALESFPPPQALLSNKQLDTSIREHLIVVNRLIVSQRSLLAANAEQLLKQLNPATDSIGFLLLLSFAFKTPESAIQRSNLLDHTVRFLIEFDRQQIRYVGPVFRSLLENVGTGKLFPPLLAVEILSKALLRLDPSGSMFTSMHLSLAKLAYDKDCIEPVLPVIDRDITFYPGMAGQKDAKMLCDKDLHPTTYISSETGLTEAVKSTMVLEYNLTCGLIYISRRDWHKAHKALERTVTHSTKDKGVSKIMVEAYKKWVLVGLLKDGQEPILPHTTQSVKNTYKTLSAAYQDVANLFSKDDAAQLKTAIDSHTPLWEDDGNLSLVHEVAGAYQKWQIINLHSVYQQVSLSLLQKLTLSAHTGTSLHDNQEMAAMVQGMIESGMLRGELQTDSDGGESYLVYRDDDLFMTETEFAREIVQCHQSIESLGRQYRVANERLSSSREYARHVAREQKRLEKEGGNASVRFESQVEDEDLMTGVVPHD